MQFQTHSDSHEVRLLATRGHELVASLFHRFCSNLDRRLDDYVSLLENRPSGSYRGIQFQRRIRRITRSKMKSLNDWLKFGDELSVRSDDFDNAVVATKHDRFSVQTRSRRIHEVSAAANSFSSASDIAHR